MINDSRSQSYSIAQLVTAAYRRSGLLNDFQTLDPVQMKLGQEELQYVCDEIEGRGVMSRSVAYYNVQLTAGVKEYPLPDYALQPIDTGMYITAGEDVSNATIERTVRKISEEEYQTLSNKALTGIPTFYYHRRDAVPTSVIFWVTPEDNGTVRLQLQRLRADSTDGSKTPDFERYWMQALIFSLAAKLCMNNSMVDKGMTYEQRAEALIDRCLNNAREQVGFQLPLTHPTGWSR